MDSTGYIMLQNAFVLVVLSVLGVLAAFFISRILDRLTGVSFRDSILPIMRRSPAATASYYGRRWMGICLLVGLLVGLRAV